MLELAEGFEQEERERLAWMIEAAERGLVPFLEKALPHIFRPEDGHFERDTAQARELIQTTVEKANFVGLRAHGMEVYQRIVDTGMQIWVYVYNGTIRDAGFNEVPRSAEQLLNGR